MNLDELKNEKLLLTMAAHAALLKAQRTLEKVLSISVRIAKQSGSHIEISGSTKATPDCPPQPVRRILSVGDNHYELALEFAKAFDAFKGVSSR
jgi:hypothetical protein